MDEHTSRKSLQDLNFHVLRVFFGALVIALAAGCYGSSTTSQTLASAGSSGMTADLLAEHLAVELIVAGALEPRFEGSGASAMLADFRVTPGLAVALAVVDKYPDALSTQESLIDLLNTTIESSSLVSSGLTHNAEYIGDVLKVQAAEADIRKSSITQIEAREIERYRRITETVMGRAVDLSSKLTGFGSAEFSAARNALATSFREALRKDPGLAAKILEAHGASAELQEARDRVHALGSQAPGVR